MPPKLQYIILLNVSVYYGCVMRATNEEMGGLCEGGRKTRLDEACEITGGLEKRAAQLPSSDSCPPHGN